jgi:hypothetical protein
MEAIKFMPAEVQQVFKEAALLDTLTSEIVEWWDILSLSARNNKQQTNAKVGRNAERLSMEREEKRTNIPPKWQAIESNFSGFDILSVHSPEDIAPLRIEVKGSTQPKSDAYFYLTRNEWEVATTTGSYCFHLWLMGQNPPQVIVVDFSVIKEHVCLDQGSGKWENIRIPFSIFS